MYFLDLWQYYPQSFFHYWIWTSPTMCQSSNWISLRQSHFGHQPVQSMPHGRPFHKYANPLISPGKWCHRWWISMCLFYLVTVRECNLRSQQQLLSLQSFCWIIWAQSCVCRSCVDVMSNACLGNKFFLLLNPMSFILSVSKYRLC